jgi:undecaprenyl-diphosphatase
VGGIAILLIEQLRPAERVDDAERVPPRIALGIGLAQILALIPGTSRSGATIMGAYCLGLSRKAAAEFSFFLAIPVMLAATLFDLFESRDLLTAADIPVFAIGFAVAFASALVVVRAFLDFVSRRSFAAFAWYRIAFGLLLLLIYARR